MRLDDFNVSSIKTAIIRLQLAFILFRFAFFLPAFLWLAPVWSITWRAPRWNNIQKNNFFRENCLILVSLSLLLIVVKKKLLLPYWNQKLSFALFSQQKKHLHVRHRSVLIQVCFFESTGLFSLYHCIKSGTCHLFSHKILGCFPGEARDILIPYPGRIVLFSALNWKSPPPLPLVNFWQVPY